MTTPLRVLIVSASEDNIASLLQTLRNDGFEPTFQCVDTAKTTQTALEEHPWDIIIADYALPHFSGMAVLPLADQFELPAIILSDTPGEEIAVAAMQAGARDYFLRGRLDRLGQAIRREMQAAQANRTIRQVESIQHALGIALSASDRPEDSVQHIIDIVTGLDHVDCGNIYLVEQHPRRLRPVGDRDESCDFDLVAAQFQFETPAMRRVMAGHPVYLDRASLADSGAHNHEEAGLRALALLPVGHRGAILAIFSLGSSTSDEFPPHTRQVLEMIVPQIGGMIARIRTEIDLRQSEERFRRVADNIQDGLIILDEHQVTYVNDRACEIFGYPREQFTGIPLRNWVAPEDRDRVNNILALADQTGRYPNTLECWIQQPGGSRRYVRNQYSLLHEGEQSTIRFVITTDLTERKLAEEKLRHRQRELESLLETSQNLSSLLDLNQLLSLIAQRAITLLKADECTLFRLEDDLITLRPILSLGEYADQIMANTLEVGEGITGHSVAQNKPLLVNHVATDGRAKQVEGTPIEDEHLMAAPLAFRGQITGAMLVSRGVEKPFEPSELDLFIGFAQQAAIALKNAEMFQELGAYKERLEYAVEIRTTQLRQAKEHVEVILENSPDAILLLDAQGTIQTINPAFSRLFGYQQGEVERESLAILVASEDRLSFEAMLRAALHRDRAGRLGITVRDKNNQFFDADVALAPITEENRVTGLVCSIRDISTLKEIERMKDAFVSNVSHELRTPITSLRLYQSLLTSNPHKQTVYLERIRRETDRLEHIINSLLDLSRLDQGRTTVNLAPTDLNRLACQYVDDRQPLAAAHNLELRFTADDALPPVHGDEGLLGQAVSILLTNAFNYTPRGGRITVSTHRRQENGQTWAGIGVSDTGPGIPPAEQPYLFERFFRGSAAEATGAPGTGLGLSLLQEIIQRHRGEVEVISEGLPGGGATFVIWLPITSEAPLRT